LFEGGRFLFIPYKVLRSDFLLLFGKGSARGCLRENTRSRGVVNDRSFFLLVIVFFALNNNVVYVVIIIVFVFIVIEGCDIVV